MTDAERAHQVLLECLDTLRHQARIHAAEADLKSAAELAAAALQVAMATLLESTEYLPDERRNEYTPALMQLRSETIHLLQQTRKLEPKK